MFSATYGRSKAHGDGTARAIEQVSGGKRTPWRRNNKVRDILMKTSIMLLLATLVLVTYSVGQEPKQALDKQTPTGDATMHTVTGSKPNTVVVEPKPLPPMNPPLGDIARQARAAHAAAAAKAEVIVDTDTAETDGAKTETSKPDSSTSDTLTSNTAITDIAPQK
jgi:hypothetical protein